MIYIIGYTCQCVVTKSAQTCLTNDPKQRPIFAMCDTVYNIVLMNIMFPIIVTDVLVPKFTLTAEATLPRSLLWWHRTLLWQASWRSPAAACPLSTTPACSLPCS